ncbi:MAG: hypothetical protein LBH25_12895 [Fibromonadaceae bacterium]|jgi:hypothetical protein|nr:hypothetical protein [Fibromonadaceae bacterium]
MNKKMPILAILICSTLLLPSNANATWLTALIDGGILVSKKIVSLLQEKQSKPEAKLAGASSQQQPSPKPKPTPEEIDDALGKLRNACQAISSRGIPCAYSEAMGCTRSSAESIASTRSIQELAKSMSTLVEGESLDSLIQSAEGGGIGIEKQEFVSGFKSTVNTQVNNSQVFLSYESKRKPYEGEACKGEVYVITTVRVLNAELFNEAVVESSLGEEIGKKLINESLKGIANKVVSSLPKKK